MSPVAGSTNTRASPALALGPALGICQRSLRCDRELGSGLKERSLHLSNRTAAYETSMAQQKQQWELFSATPRPKTSACFNHRWLTMDPGLLIPRTNRNRGRDNGELCCLRTTTRRKMLMDGCNAGRSLGEGGERSREFGSPLGFPACLAIQPSHL